MNLREQLKAATITIGEINEQRRELQYKLNVVEKDFVLEREGHQKQVFLLEETVEELKHSVLKYQDMFEEKLLQHAKELKENKSYHESKILEMKKEHLKSTDNLVLKNSQRVAELDALIVGLQEDKSLKKQHITQLNQDLELSQLEIVNMDKRLDRQVLVDQNIEKELQEELVVLKLENRQLKKECRLMGEQYDLIEAENTRLRKQAQMAQGTSKRLEGLVYGKVEKPPKGWKSRTSDSVGKKSGKVTAK